MNFQPIPQEILQTHDDSRDERWEDLFLQALSQTQLRLLSQEAQQGPDQWPYLMVSTEQADESAQKILHWLSTRGIGLVINPEKNFPDFILSYGMIWFFRETGRFILRNAAAVPSTSVEISSASLKKFGPPTEAYLPGYVRKVLQDFFRDQGIIAPRCLVISENGTDFDLAISVESLGNPPQKEWPQIGEALSWFLPAHYSLVLISEKGMPEFVAV